MKTSFRIKHLIRYFVDKLVLDSSFKPLAKAYRALKPLVFMALELNRVLAQNFFTLIELMGNFLCGIFANTSKHKPPK
jgi:hypothetical protein